MAFPGLALLPLERLDAAIGKADSLHLLHAGLIDTQSLPPFTLLFLMQGGFELSVASTHRDHPTQYKGPLWSRV
jgi:hypothetical protein